MKMKVRVCVVALASAMFVNGNAVFAKGELAASAQQVAPAAVAVKIDNFKFGPEDLTVAVGTTVTWTNRDDIPHTVVSTTGAFKSKVLDTDETFSFTFTKAGTYDYFCSVHPKMTGKVIVQ
jgi:amicyanin